jgi:hypothetical protein
MAWVFVVAALLAGAAGPVQASVVLLDEYWTPDIAHNDVQVAEVDTESTGDPTQAVAGYFSVRLENQTGAPSVRFRSANSGLYKDLPPDVTEARLWYRTDKWNGKLALQLWAMVPRSAPVMWLEAELDGGGEDGRLIADGHWHQAKGILRKGNDFERVPMDDIYRTGMVWLRPIEGWDIAHTTFVDRIEAVVISGPGKGEPMSAPARHVRRMPGAQTSGPGFVRWEAEDALDPVPEPTNTLVPRDADAQKLLSNGAWAQGATDQVMYPYEAPEDAESFRYSVAVAEAGDYSLWLRAYCKRSSFRWRWDDGEWHTSGPGTESIGAVMLTGNWLPVGWSHLGRVELAAGEHTFEVQTMQMPDRTALGYDCYVLARDAFVPPAMAPTVETPEGMTR